MDKNNPAIQAEIKQTKEAIGNLNESTAFLERMIGSSLSNYKYATERTKEGMSLLIDRIDSLFELLNIERESEYKIFQKEWREAQKNPKPFVLDNETTKKVCKKCGEEKDLNLFTKDSECVNGRSGSCRNCTNKNQAVQRNKRKAKIKQIKDFEDKVDQNNHKDDIIDNANDLVIILKRLTGDHVFVSSSNDPVISCVLKSEIPLQYKNYDKHNIDFKYLLQAVMHRMNEEHYGMDVIAILEKYNVTIKDESHLNYTDRKVYGAMYDAVASSIGILEKKFAFNFLTANGSQPIPKK